MLLLAVVFDEHDDDEYANAAVSKLTMSRIFLMILLV
jgi:hypothetical protein